MCLQEQGRNDLVKEWPSNSELMVKQSQSSFPWNRMVTQRSSSKDVQSVTSDFWNSHLAGNSSGSEWRSWVIIEAAAQSSSFISGRASSPCASLCMTDSPASRSSIQCDTANTTSQVLAERTTSSDHLLNSHFFKKHRTVSIALFYCKMFFPKTSLAKNPLRFESCLNLASKMNWCLNGDKIRALGPELSQG